MERSGRSVGTLGSRLGKFFPGKLMEKALGIIFALVGALVLVLEFWK